MQLFQCSYCQHPIYFDNTQCTVCQHHLGFDAQYMHMLALQPGQRAGEFVEAVTQKAYRFCQNHQHQVCNWIIPFDSPEQFCPACRLNRIIPDLNQPQYYCRWQKIELAKHRLVYALLRWNLPLLSKLESPERGLVFDFKANPNDDRAPKVMTGHASGVITLNIAEADNVERMMAKQNMAEVYRTLLGHFRHEIGHYYWDVLVANSDYLARFRQLFGDERACYQQAVKDYYQHGAPSNWMDAYISAYATMHPWEDWAESWAHYLHIVDVLETATSFGMSIHPQIVHEEQHFMYFKQRENPYFLTDFNEIFQAWLPVAFAMNSVNRSMGQEDFYPFVISPKVMEKLQLIHQVIHGLPPISDNPIPVDG